MSDEERIVDVTDPDDGRLRIRPSSLPEALVLSAQSFDGRWATVFLTRENVEEIINALRAWHKSTLS